MRDLLARFAAGAPVPVFAIAGSGARGAVQDLRLRPELRFVDSPRAASILLVTGAIPNTLTVALQQVHDQLPHPRATAWWPRGSQPPEWLASFSSPVVLEGDDPVPGLVALQHTLITGGRPSESPILPDEDAIPWRGVGPYGQGGGGMTGGTPYGRPMASLGNDPDGLRLDVLPQRTGPFFPRFPAGLELELKLAGDLILEAQVRVEHAAGHREGGPARPGIRPFLRALTEPVPVAELELSRAREHLRWLSEALVAVELQSLGLRALRLAHTAQPGDGDAVRRLAGTLRWTQALGWATKGVGRIEPGALDGLGAGPVARASGLREDARMDDPAYRQLGFEPIVQEECDAAARWRQRLAEAAQSLDLAGRAGDLQTQPLGVVESPRGRLEAGSSPTMRVLELVPSLLREVEWGDAITTLTSLDIDLDEGAAVQPMVAAGVAS